VLELGELTRVGSTRPRKLDVRFVAATHRDLAQLIAAGEFRHDLYFRLNGVAVEIPPLRDRTSEIMPLATMFLRHYAARLERPALRFDQGVDDVLRAHDWPGNVRELRSVVERSAAMCRSELIRGDDVAFGSAGRHRPATRHDPARSSVLPSQQGIRSELRAFERTRILTALTRTRGNQTEAAKLLGVSRRTLTSKLKSLEIRERRGHFTRGPDEEHLRHAEREPGDHRS
jgi:DNA-binding NtrC family response regulator